MDELVRKCSSLYLGDFSDKELMLALERSSLVDALKANTSNPHSKNGDAIWERTGEAPSPEGPAFGVFKASAETPKKKDKYDELSRLDYYIDQRYRSVQQTLDQLSHQGENNQTFALTTTASFIAELQTSMGTARALRCVSADDEHLKAAFLDRCEKLKLEMQKIAHILEQRQGPSHSEPAFYDSTKLDPGLDKKDPLTLLAAFIVLVLSVFGSLVREWANSALQLQLILLRTAHDYLRPTGPSPYHSAMMDGFPRDIRTARQIFQLDPETITFAACPRCSFLYRVSPNADLPVHCTARRFPTSAPCGETISKLGLRDNSQRRMGRVPIRPYVIQNFDSFKATLLSRPGMESLLDQGTVFNNSEESWDIKDGTTIRELKGPDGKPFLDGLRRQELRLAWSLSIDWFNPFLNKIAGRTASAGSVVMSCLNLPPSLRYKSENLYIVGVIPGPREPSVDDFDHFLEPIVDFLDHSWRYGTKFSKTDTSPSGRIERSILAVVVADLPGARKITGTASHSSTSCFCSLCRLSKDKINNLDADSWPTLSIQRQKQIAESWRNAPNKAARKRIFNQFGIRWSSLWKLEYFNPLKMVVVDAMHNLFLGLVQFHTREVLGIAAPRSDPDPVPVIDDAEKEAALAALRAGKLTKLKRSRLPVLQALCAENGIDYSRKKKDVLINLLLKDRTPEKGLNPDIIRVPVADVLTAADSVGVEELIGEGYISECQSSESDIFKDTLTKGELTRIRQNLQSVTRPQYRQGPPKNLGEAAHGKLRASQWKTLIEFDLPVNLALLRSKETSSATLDPIAMNRRNKVFESIMHLAIAIRWGTSYRTSPLHAAKYNENMKLYLQSLIDLYPDIRLRPNHHSALHISEKLLQFGPVHGWWMFPFERVIGKLQKINTNHKLGELESTMLTSFCAGANLKALIESDCCPGALLPAASILKRQLDDALLVPDQPQAADTYHTARAATSQNPTSLASPTAIAALKSAFIARSVGVDNWPSQVRVKGHRYLYIGGVRFSVAAASRRNAEVSFNTGGSRVPGIIESILSMEHHGAEVFVLGVRRRKSWTPQTAIPNPFIRFPDFGAELWLREIEDTPTYISLTSPIYHTQSQVWYDRCVVVKEIKPVGPYPSRGLATTDDPL